LYRHMSSRCVPFAHHTRLDRFLSREPAGTSGQKVVKRVCIIALPCDEAVSAWEKSAEGAVVLAATKSALVSVKIIVAPPARQEWTAVCPIVAPVASHCVRDLDLEDVLFDALAQSDKLSL